MSNLIKSGFVAFADDNVIKIDANENKIIKGIDQAIEESQTPPSMEEAIAEAMLEDAELEGLELPDGDTDITLDTAGLPDLTDALISDGGHASEDIINSAKKEAEEIINRAHDEAENLRGEAYDEAKSIRDKAKEEGYQEGYSEGIKTAGVEYEEKNRELEERTAQFEIEMTEKEDKLINDTAAKITEWLIKMIPHITGVSIEGEEGVLLYMINNAMRDQENSRNFVVKVSPDDYAYVSEHKEAIYGALNPGIELEIYEDVKLQKFECLIETDNGIVDIGLDAQLSNLTKALKLLIKES